MTEKVVWHVVKTYAKKLEIPKLAQHDLRRSCARFCHAAGGELDRFNSCSGTCPYKQQSVTWGVNKSFVKQ